MTFQDVMVEGDPALKGRLCGAQVDQFERNGWQTKRSSYVTGISGISPDPFSVEALTGRTAGKCIPFGSLSVTGKLSASHALDDRIDSKTVANLRFAGKNVASI